MKKREIERQTKQEIACPIYIQIHLEAIGMNKIRQVPSGRTANIAIVLEILYHKKLFNMQNLYRLKTS